MAIGRAMVGLLAEEAKARPFYGRLATFGKQTVTATPQEISWRMGLDVAARGPLDDVRLFGLLGFQTTDSIDASDFEGATHVVDLNRDIPAELRNGFDTVFDCGTIEHVFNLPKALENLVNLTKVDGRIILCSPSSNYMDHGFYMLSPTLFMDFFRANKLRVDTFYVIRHGTNPNTPWRAYAYEPGSFAKFHVGCLDRHPYMIFTVVTKMAESTADHIPQQAYYTNAWAATREPSRLYSLAQAWIGWIPGGLEFAIAVRNRVKPSGIRALRYVGSY